MTRPQGSISRGIILLRRSNGSRVLEDKPRDMPGYRGDGPEATLALVLERIGAQAQAAWDSGRNSVYEDLQERSARMRGYR